MRPLLVGLDHPGQAACSPSGGCPSLRLEAAEHDAILGLQLAALPGAALH